MISFDRALSARAIATGADTPALWTTARWVTELGGAPVLWAVTLVAAVLLWRARRLRHLAVMLATVAGGRISVELLKVATDRPRPHLVEHRVFTHSLSMPSGHAANSMLVYLTVALLLAPERHRRTAIIAAVLLSIAIGLTRPVLGVHWPSDVLAGWLWGAGLALVATSLAARWLEGDRSRPPSATA